MNDAQKIELIKTLRKCGLELLNKARQIEQSLPSDDPVVPEKELTLSPHATIDSLSLPTRVRKAIHRASPGGYGNQRMTLKDVAKLTTVQILEARNVGTDTLNKIRSLLMEAGLHLADD